MTGKELNKWADSFMFEAEVSDAAAGPQAYLLGAPVDPLGHIAACAKMYKGEVVRDLRDVTNAERQEYLREIQKTVLAMPLESVHLHFMLEGVHRGITHQMVRQRTGAYAQESTRFAVKRDLKTATALPPSLEDTVSFEELVDLDLLKRKLAGLEVPDDEDDLWHVTYRLELRKQVIARGGKQAQRLMWDEAVDKVGDVYNTLVDIGMPAEDARGLMPTNITTRLNYITNLRSFYDTMAVRVSDQAQFEWRKIAMAYALAMREYGEKVSYWTTITYEEYRKWDDNGEFGPILQRDYPYHHTTQIESEKIVHVRLSSKWQYIALTNEIKPIEFKKGGPAFGANFDRPSRIGERVAAFAQRGVPSSQWTQGSPEHGIPPIHPEEWLLDPNSARLESGMEFDIFGNRVPAGTGWHWEDGMLARKNPQEPCTSEYLRWPQDFYKEEER